MLYVTRGENDTGQRLVSCPHVRTGVVNQWLYPDGSAVYEVTGVAFGLFFRPSHRTIIIWCQDCFETFGKGNAKKLEKKEGLGDSLTV